MQSTSDARAEHEQDTSDTPTIRGRKHWRCLWRKTLWNPALRRISGDWRWVWIACLLLPDDVTTGRIERDGEKLTSEEIADQAAVSLAETRAALEYFINKEMLEVAEDGCYVVLRYLEHQVHRTSIARAKRRANGVLSSSTSTSTSTSKGGGKRRKIVSDAVKAAREFGFELFWADYPRKVAKEAAAEVWLRMTDEQRKAARGAVLQHATKWALEGREDRVIPHAATWLNNKRWQDDLGEVPAAHRDQPWSEEDFAEHGLESDWTSYIDECSYEYGLERPWPRYAEWEAARRKAIE